MRGRKAKLVLWLGLLGLLAVSPLNAVLWSIAVAVGTSALALTGLLAAHEIGHALCGLLVGFRVRRIVLGVGRPLARLRFRGLAVHLNLIPVGGATMGVPSASLAGLRWRAFVFTAGGPATHVAVMVGLAMAGIGPWGGGGSHMLSGTLAVLNTLMLVGNLLPVSENGTGLGATSDGYKLLTLLFGSREAIRQVPFQYLAAVALAESSDGRDAQAVALCEQGLAAKPDSLTLRIALGKILQERDPARARAVWAEGLALARQPFDRASFMNSVAWADFALRDDRLLAEGDRYSEEAVRRYGRLSAFAGTRAAILLRLGRPRAAKALLGKALVRSLFVEAHATDLALLAMAEALLGERAAAERHLARARRLGGEAAVVAEADALVASAGAPRHVFRASRGERAVAVDGQGVELHRAPGPERDVGEEGRPTGARPGTLRRHGDIEQIRIERTVRGRAWLRLIGAGWRWRMPIAPADAATLRMRLHPFFERGGPWVAPADVVPRKWLVRTIAGLALLAAPAMALQVEAIAMMLFPLLVCAVTTLVRPDPVPLLTLGAGLIATAATIFTEPEVDRSAVLLALPALALGLVAIFLAPWAARRAPGRRDATVWPVVLVPVGYLLSGLERAGPTLWSAPSWLRLHTAFAGDLTIAIAAAMLAATYALRAEPLARVGSVLCASLALVAFCASTPWFGERVALGARVAPAPLPNLDQAPLEVLRAIDIRAPGSELVVSPHGRRFLIQAPAADGARVVLGDFEGARVELPATNASFLDDDTLITVQPATASTELRALSVGEVPRVLWTEALPALASPKVAVARETGAVRVVGRLRQGGAVEIWRPAGGPVQHPRAIPVDVGDQVVGWWPGSGPRAGGLVFARRRSAPRGGSRPGGPGDAGDDPRQFFPDGDRDVELWSLSAGSRRLLAPVLPSLRCFGAGTAGGRLFCLGHGMRFTPVFSVDGATGEVRGLARTNVAARAGTRLVDGRLAIKSWNALLVIDVDIDTDTDAARGRATRLTPARPSFAFALATLGTGGALATLDGGGPPRGEGAAEQPAADQERTVTLYRIPPPSPASGSGSAR